MEECSGELVDELLDWEDNLPPGDLLISEEHCKRADLSLCLGTSLRVQVFPASLSSADPQPANELPLKSQVENSSLVIISLSSTPLDYRATCKLSGDVDDLMREVMRRLNIEVPKYDPSQDFVLSKQTLQFPKRELLSPPQLLKRSGTVLQNNRAAKKIKKEND